jgi:hypothetical protein
MLQARLNYAAQFVVYSREALSITIGGLPMRFLLAFLFVSLIVILAQPSAAQDKDEAAKAKRIVEIHKEIQELHDKIAKLKAEMIKLQPAAKPPDLSLDDKVMQGIIKSPQHDGFDFEFDLGNAFDLGIAGSKQAKHRVELTADARIVFSDKQPAKIADMKAGQSVTFRFMSLREALSDPPTFFYPSDFVIIKKAKGEKKERP